MRKILISMAAAASAVALASPASAQGYYYPQPQGYAYGNQGYANTGRFRAELQQIHYATRDLAARGRLTRAEGRDMQRDLRSAERALYSVSRNGVTRREARQMQERISRLHYQVRVYSDRDGRRNRWR